MRVLLAALVLACAFASAGASERALRVAQMARDVTDAVRKQRARQPRHDRKLCESKR